MGWIGAADRRGLDIDRRGGSARLGHGNARRIGALSGINPVKRHLKQLRNFR
jgi:hypothetical protein